MSELLMFNPNTLDQMWINPAKHEEVNKYKELGWVQNPRLVHMYNPSTNDNKMVMVQTRKLWEDKGYYAEPAFIYHPVEGTKVVPSAEVKKMLSNGWYSSPAHFPGNDIGKLKTLVLKEAS